MKNFLTSEFSRLFGTEPTVFALAPGRIEVIGNHTDYNGGPVLGAAIDRSVFVTARQTNNGRWNFRSAGEEMVVTVTDGALEKRHGAEAWANYPLGVLQALNKRGMSLPNGMDFLVGSDLPSGAGLSSSAALELASALVLCEMTGFTISREEMVKACREAENEFVGVPCGILDQGVSGFGREDHLVHIDCRGPIFTLAAIPSGIRFWIFNTHAKHSLVDSLYATRHLECRQALSMLREAGVVATWLAEVDLKDLERHREALPDPIYRRARHVIEETARVAALQRALGSEDLRAAGELLVASHESSRTLFENSTDELDFLVKTLSGVDGVYGARLTGGGFGGAALALTGSEFSLAEAGKVAEAYAARFGSRPEILECATADGARLIPVS